MVEIELKEFKVSWNQSSAYEIKIMGYNEDDAREQIEGGDWEDLDGNPTIEAGKIRNFKAELTDEEIK